jgi:hypothetical protein
MHGRMTTLRYTGVLYFMLAERTHIIGPARSPPLRHKR